MWLGVHEPVRLQVCACPGAPEWGALGLRVCAPGAVDASNVHCSRVPHVLALNLTVNVDVVKGACSPAACAACGVAAADWAGPGRLAVKAHVLSNALDASGTLGLARTQTTEAPTVTPNGRVTWTEVGGVGVLELSVVTWCGAPVALPATLLWDQTAVVREVGLGAVAVALRTPALCAAAVRLNGTALCDVPAALQTPALCAAAVQHDGSALQYVPWALRTKELCAAAVERNGSMLGNVTWSWRTSALCAAAVQQNGLALHHVPRALCTPELCAVAVQQNGLALQHVPRALRTSALCAAAVRQDGMALRYVCPSDRTYELCTAAINQHVAAWTTVPDGHPQSHGLRQQYMQRWGGTLRAVRGPAESEKQSAGAVCLTAVRNPAFCDFSSIPREYWTSALLWAGLEASVTRCVRPQWAALCL